MVFHLLSTVSPRLFFLKVIILREETMRVYDALAYRLDLGGYLGCIGIYDEYGENVVQDDH